MYIVRQFYYLNFQVLPFRFWELYLTSWCLSIIEKLKHACSKTKILRCVSSLSFVFFWVIPRRLIYICRRFGTLSVPSSKAPAFEDGTDRVFRNVGIYKSDAGESPKRKQTTFWTRRKLEIKKFSIVLLLFQLQINMYLLTLPLSFSLFWQTKYSICVFRSLSIWEIWKYKRAPFFILKLQRSSIFISEYSGPALYSLRDIFYLLVFTYYADKISVNLPLLGAF